jgi:hypothetical protein
LFYRMHYLGLRADFPVSDPKLQSALTLV